MTVVGTMPREVGAAIRAAREQRRWSLRAAADRVGVARLRMHLLEQSASLPDEALASRLVEVFDLDESVAGALRVAARRRAELERVSPTCRVVTRGRRSGTPRVKEWFYFVLVDGVGPCCFLEPAGRKAQWIQNLLADPDVGIEVNGQRFRGRARVVSEESERVAIGEMFLAKYRPPNPAPVDMFTHGVGVVVEDVRPEARWDQR